MIPTDGKAVRPADGTVEDDLVIALTVLLHRLGGTAAITREEWARVTADLGGQIARFDFHRNDDVMHVRVVGEAAPGGRPN